MSTRNNSYVKHKSKRNSYDADEKLNQVALLLAGGDGIRLQELTSEIAGTPIPKQ
jgi:hypothetical protein